VLLEQLCAAITAVLASCTHYTWRVLPCCLSLRRPFLLQSKLSMTQMGLFSISGYPYSFKLLWSPIVDSVYSAAFGRRKSWIVPVQLASAALLMFSADWIQTQYEAGAVGPLTVLFFFFVLLAATQVNSYGLVRGEAAGAADWSCSCQQHYCTSSIFLLIKAFQNVTQHSEKPSAVFVRKARKVR
jgi:hypothetical protein